MSTELQQIQNLFKTNHIPLSTEWLDSCIEWCKDGDVLPPNSTIIDIQKMVYQQWLMLDLRDVEVPLLPRNLSNEKKYCLTGTYCLQMMHVVDISKPKLWQLQRIRNNAAKNTEAERDFGKRVLQLNLTDGVQEVEAMEFEPITCLNINLCPGTKIKITGPLMVRNGRLMLKDENVKCLGGAVDEMKVQFAAENVLARALRLEENPEPYTIDENALEVLEENTTTQINATVHTQTGNSLNQNRNQNQNYQAQHRSNTSTNQNINRTNQNVVSSNQNISITQKTTNNRHYNEDIPTEFQVDDDLLRELEADFEEQSVRSALNIKANTRNLNNSNFSNLKTNPPKPIKNVRRRDCSSPDLFENMELDDNLLNDHFDQMDVDQTTSNAKRECGSNITKRVDSYQSSIIENTKPFRSNKNTKLVQDLEVSSSVIPKAKPSTNKIITLDDSFDDIDIDSHLDDIDEEMANLPSSTQILNDLKNRVKSPELKSRKLSSYNAKPVSDVNSINFTQKKLTQGTLNFGSHKKLDLNLPPSIGLNSLENTDNNPFSIFTKPPQKSVCLLRPDSPEFKSKYLPSTSNTVSFPSQKPSSIGNADQFYQKSSCNLSTSKTSSNVLQDANKPLSAELLTSPPSSYGVLTIEKLKKMMPNISKGKFKIKAAFQSVVEKLQQTDDAYRCVILLQDDTGDLTVDLHSDVVTSMVGLTPQELSRLKVLALQDDLEVRDQIMALLKNLQQKLVKLNNILEIQVTRGEKFPVVINIQW